MLQNYSLSLVLIFLFIVSWIGQGVAQWSTFIQEQAEHNRAALFSDFIPEFTSATLENWQSEFLQLFSFVILSSFLIHKGSSQSKDSDEEVKTKLENIQALLSEAVVKKTSEKTTRRKRR